MSDLIQKASAYAVHAHRRIDHRRKYSGQPYDAHLKEVAGIVATVSDDPETIAAAWLHDVVEDTPATFADLEIEFGDAVAQLVRELTDVSKPGDGNRSKRKAIDREHLATASSRGKTIKLADIIDNCRDICRNDPKFAKVYLAEAQQLMEVMDGADQRLMKRAGRQLAKCARQLGLEDAAPNREPEEIADQEIFFGSQKRVLRHFFENFVALDLAEPLRSFDAATAAKDVLAVMRKYRLDTVGVRHEGLVKGFVHLRDLQPGHPSLTSRPIKRDQVVSATASFSEVILILTRYEQCFVSSIDALDAVITRIDVEKPIARMWLFGMITTTEMEMAERIRTVWPDGSWARHLSSSRLAIAEALLSERLRRNQHSDLVECLQLSDKFGVLIKDPQSLESFGFSSVAAAKKVANEFQALRNNLAHSQDFVEHHWAQIARMAQRFEKMAKLADDSYGQDAMS